MRNVLLAGQAAAEALMLDTCRIERASTTKPIWDEANGVEVQAPPTLVYAGKCRVQRRSLADARVDAGERAVTVETVELQVPIAVGGVDINDVATIVTSGDVALVGRRLVIADDFAKSHATARRLRCREVTG